MEAVFDERTQADKRAGNRDMFRWGKWQREGMKGPRTWAGCPVTKVWVETHNLETKIMAIEKPVGQLNSGVGCEYGCEYLEQVCTAVAELKRRIVAAGKRTL